YGFAAGCPVVSEGVGTLDGMEVGEALERVVGALPGGGERRLGQREMADAVATALESDRHLIVRAGTGTGKSLAYLLPTLLSGKRVVVATATKALQDQLAGKDLPFLEQHLGAPVRFSVLKGRSNYLCVQKATEIGQEHSGQLDLDDLSDTHVRNEVVGIIEWAKQSKTGD